MRTDFTAASFSLLFLCKQEQVETCRVIPQLPNFLPLLLFLCKQEQVDICGTFTSCLIFYFFFFLSKNKCTLATRFQLLLSLLFFYASKNIWNLRSDFTVASFRPFFASRNEWMKPQALVASTSVLEGAVGQVWLDNNSEIPAWPKPLVEAYVALNLEVRDFGCTLTRSLRCFIEKGL